MSASQALVAFATCCLITAATYADDAAWFKVHGGSWEPDSAAISRIQSDLQPAVARLAGSHFNDFRHWWKYKFQYQGQRTETGLHVLINALCDAYEDRDLTAQFVVVNDGGPCFFEVKYDPKAQRFYDLVINGDA
jgi:hypothetical protein